MHDLTKRVEGVMKRVISEGVAYVPKSLATDLIEELGGDKALAEKCMDINGRNRDLLIVMYILALLAEIKKK